MKALVCEMCGSTDIELVNGVLTCRACDTKYTLNDRSDKQSGTPSYYDDYDDTMKCECHIDLAKKAFDNEDYDLALRQLGIALDIDDGNAEAWLLVMFTYLQQNRINITDYKEDGTVYDDDCYVNCLVSGVWPEKRRHRTPSELLDAQPVNHIFATDTYNTFPPIIEAGKKAVKCSNGKYSEGTYTAYLFFLKHHFLNISNRLKLTDSIRKRYMDNLKEVKETNPQSYLTHAVQAALMTASQDTIGDSLLQLALDAFPLREAIPNNTISDNLNLYQINKEVAENWKMLESSLKARLKTYGRTPSDEVIADLRKKHQQITVKPNPLFDVLTNNNSTNNASQAKSEGCYVATAVYGSYDCPEVWTLRRFRDDILRPTTAGRAFIKLYYRVSPTLVKRVGNTRWFNAMCRLPLDHLVERLRRQGIADTPYNDL